MYNLILKVTILYIISIFKFSMKVIIIEGTDNVGKDTVINRLTHEFDKFNIYHCEKPKSKTYIEQAQEQELSFIDLLGKTLYEYTITNDYYSSDSYCLIHNRSWYGEYVYGCMYRNNLPIFVKRMINSIEKILTKVVNEEDLCFITLLSDNADFLVRNDDGLSISNANKDKIIQETHRFEDIYKESIIKNKHIVYVNNGDKFRDKDDIYNEILGYIFNKEFNKEKDSDVKDELTNVCKKVPVKWLEEHGLTIEQYNEIRHADKITDSLYQKYIYPGSNLTAQQLFDIHSGLI